MNRFDPDLDDIIAFILLLAILLGVGVYFYSVLLQGQH